MRFDSPRWHQINPSEFTHERDGLRELASYLPDAEPFQVWANVEFVGTDGSINEVDALVLTRSGLHLLELKHWRGELRGDGTRWRRKPPGGRSYLEDNPLILTNRKAKRLRSLMKHYAPPNARVPFVNAAVFMHAREMRSELDELGRQHVYGLDGVECGLPSLKQFLLAPPANAAHLVDAERGRQITDLVRGSRIRPSVADRRINQLMLHQRPIAEGVGWQDFLADHVLEPSTLRRVRFYLTSRAVEEDASAIRRAAEREFRLLQGIHHPGIARALDLVDHQYGPAVVFDHRPEWVRLDQWLAERHGQLQLAQRLQLVQDLAEIVDHAHARRLAHRSLHPGAIFVCDPDGPRPTLMVTDWQTGSRAATTRMTRHGSATDPAILELFFDDGVRRYQAPEAAVLDDAPGHQLDVFSLGALAYRICSGVDPAASAEELVAAVAGGGLRLDAAADGMPDALVTAIYDATRGDPAARCRLADFRAGLELTWDELTAPEPEPVVDPIEARRGDLLDGGLTVLSRLGSGATAIGLLVRQPTDGGHRDLVLKVARDEQFADRFAAEARAVASLRDSRVAALVDGPITVGSRTALLLESAGDRTLAEDLRGGRLALDLLERYGRDLLEIAATLDAHGVWHRDIKPANLASRPRPKDKQPHLCIFDFSLAAVPADQLTAGTTGYLDPFLGPPSRTRYDAAAERFAVAVTLYEMATGALPRWGDGANPAVISDEVTLDPADFDDAVADGLIAFFGKALARDTADRFDTLDEMTDAWRGVFRQLHDSVEDTDDIGAGLPLRRESPLAATDLTPRARSALERHGIHTVGELLDAEPSQITRARGVPDATRKEILARVRALRAQLAESDDPPAGGDRPMPHGVEALCAALLPPETTREQWQRHALRVLLGQEATPGGGFLRWPSQGEVARAVGKLQPQISTLLRRAVAKLWQPNVALRMVAEEIVALLDGRGGVMSCEEAAEALVAARGSYTPEPQRSAQAIGLVRAAVEVELARGGDSRLAIQRLRGRDTVLIGREPDDPAAQRTAADLLSYVVRLGRRAVDLAGGDPLPTRQRAVAELRTLVTPPAGMPALTEVRLLQLAAAGSGGDVDVNAQGQLYPAGMPAERAVRLAAGALVGQKLDVEGVVSRVRSRFPRAQPVPPRPALDELLRDVPLTWHAQVGRFVPPEVGSSVTGTRVASTVGPILGPDAAGETLAKLTDVVRRRGFLAVLASIRRLAVARAALLASLDLVELNVTTMLLGRLRALGFPWEAIVAADNGRSTDADFRSLVELVQHHVIPDVREAIDAAADRPVLITEAAPLARYHQLGLVQELADPTRPRPAARLLLVPARKPEPAVLDDRQLPLTSPVSQTLWLPEEWIKAAAPERTAAR